MVSEGIIMHSRNTATCSALHLYWDMPGGNVSANHISPQFPRMSNYGKYFTSQVFRQSARIIFGLHRLYGIRHRRHIVGRFDSREDMHS